MTQLLVNDAPFNFSEECIQAFDTLKCELTQAPIMIKTDWSLPFKIMCDASDYAIGVVLGQRIDKHFKPIHYANKTMNEAQENYTTTKKELLAVMFAFKKFCQYLVLSKTICADWIIRRCIAGDEAAQILRQCRSGPSGGHYGITTTARNVFEAGFYWPHVFRDACKLVQICDACQRAENISSRDEAPQNYIQINELDEMRLDAYESSISYKERTKRLFPGKLKSRWYGPFSVSKDMKNRAIELYDEEGSKFIVNKQWVKPYQNNLLDTNKDDDVTLHDEGEVT
ncbi:reverse transcriptase domain-containing protein [Tanacetum coccineum]